MAGRRGFRRSAPATADVTGLRPPSVGAAVARTVLAGVVAFVLLALAGAQALQKLATTEAVHAAQEMAQAEARSVVEPALSQSVVDGDPAAVAAFDHVIRTRLLRGGVVRVKLWSADGRIVYSDDERYIGRRFGLRGRAAQVLQEGGTQARLTRLRDPEHRFDTTEERILEVYERLRAPDGSPLLFELYLRNSTVTADGGRIWRSFAPAFLGALLVQQLLQVPLSWSLARRLRSRHDERERLLLRSLHASDIERRRIARDLHDGAVQMLSGVAYTLEAVSGGPDLPSQRAALDGAVRDTRPGVAELRSLLVEIYPPALEAAGLLRALEDLASHLRTRGVRTTVTVADGLDLSAVQERLVYRVAQEAVRNVARHARAGSACIRVVATPSGTCLPVTDDGKGFDVDHVTGRTEHFGLVMAAELADEAGGRLTVDSRPGAGTTVRLELP